MRWPRRLRWTAWTVAFLGLAGPLRGQQSLEPPPSEEVLEPDVSLRIVPDPLPPGAPEPTVGDSVWATVRAFGPPGTYLLPASVTDAYASRPELAVLGSERRDGQLRLRIAVFRPGDVVLPAAQALVATSAGDTLTVPMLSDTFHIASVLAPGDTLLADIKPLWPAPGIPLWVWAVLAAALAAALLAVVWWWLRRRKRPSEALAGAGLDPYEEARRRIEALAAEPASAPERIAAAAAIGDAIRGYLADRWFVPARERTSFEILHALPEPLARDRPALGAFLSEVDLAKFARLAPAPGRIPALAARAIGWLESAEEARTPPAVSSAEEEAAS
ncbi:MAG: hypothetical protein ACREK2_01875 [Gemmatimonadota bacterium]